MVQRLSRVRLDEIWRVWLRDGSSFSGIHVDSTSDHCYYYMMSGVTGCTNSIPRGAQCLRASPTNETQIWLEVWSIHAEMTGLDVAIAPVQPTPI